MTRQRHAGNVTHTLYGEGCARSEPVDLFAGLGAAILVALNRLDG